MIVEVGNNPCYHPLRQRHHPVTIEPNGIGSNDGSIGMSMAVGTVDHGPGPVTTIVVVTIVDHDPVLVLVVLGAIRVDWSR